MRAVLCRIALSASLLSTAPVFAQPDATAPSAQAAPNAMVVPGVAAAQSAPTANSGSQAVVPGSVFATNASKASPGPSFAPMGVALALVLGLMAGVVWLLRRSGLAPKANKNSVLKVVSQLALGPRERVVVVQIENRWLVVGVSPAGVTRLASLPKGAGGSVDAGVGQATLKVPAPFAALVDQLNRKGS
jgi:flagellar protein FliO/FliZ